MAGERHGRGMLCVNPPIESQFEAFILQSWKLFFLILLEEILYHGMLWAEMVTLLK
jgi:hypothetical protein